MISTSDYLSMQLRLTKNKVPQPTKAAERETGHGGLQEQILKDCEAKWPRWKVIRARPDKRSTIAVGCHDLTIFADKGRVFLVECKAKGNKASKEQLAWAKELEMLGHTVHFVWSVGEWERLVTEPALVDENERLTEQLAAYARDHATICYQCGSAVKAPACASTSPTQSVPGETQP